MAMGPVVRSPADSAIHAPDRDSLNSNCKMLKML